MDELIKYTIEQISRKLLNEVLHIGNIDKNTSSFEVNFAYRGSVFIVKYSIRDDFSIIHFQDDGKKINIFSYLHPIDSENLDLDIYYKWKESVPNFSDSKELCSYLVSNLDKYLAD